MMSLTLKRNYLNETVLSFLLCCSPINEGLQRQIVPSENKDT
jgi:hypothetical protein